MQLVQATIKHFRGINDPITIEFDSYNLLIGKNDAGKSIILKALDLFLNNSEAMRDMLNENALDENVEIILTFDIDEVEIIIDDVVTTTFQQEELVNEEGLLQIKRVWNTDKSRITYDTYLLRKIYDNDFLLLAERDLIKLCGTYDIQTQKGNNDEYNNVEKRKKLREYYKNQNIPSRYDYEKLATSGKGRTKLINDTLNKLLPRFEYFKADSSLSESDTAIQNYFKTFALNKLSEYGTADIEAFVKEELSGICEKIADKINDVVSTDEQVEPDIKFDWSKLITTTFKSKNSDSNIPLKLRGDGFRRITMMSYFEYLAEGKAEEKQNIIFGFEEPETFLHPSAQENLFEKMVLMSEAGYQVVITSHSPIIVSHSDRNKVIHVKKENGSINYIQNISDFTDIVTDLGITVDNQFIKEFDRAKVILLVEGIDDANAFNYISEKYKENNIIDKSFKDLGILLIPIGGCGSIQHWHSLNLLTELNKPFHILLDSDKEAEHSESPNRNKLNELGFKEHTDFTILTKRNLENYINPKVLFRHISDLEISYNDWTNVKKLCKTHPLNGALGGKNIAEKYFMKQTFEEIKEIFSYDESKDEFLDIYNLVIEKI